MKFILKNLKNFILAHKIIFIIFILCEFTSFVTATYIATRFSSTQRERVENNFAYRTFFVEGDFAKENVTEKIDQIKQEFPQVSMIKVYMDTLHMQANFLYPPKTERYVYAGRYFSEKEFFNGSKHIIINEDSDKFAVGNIIQVRDMIFEVIGINYSIGNYSEVPYSALTNLDEITRISFSFDTIPKSQERQRILLKLKDVFPINDVKPPEDIDIFTVSSGAIEYAICIAVALFALFNISYLYEYVLDCRKKYFLVMRLVGCSRKKAFWIFAVEILLLTTIVYSISCIFLSLVIIPAAVDVGIKGISAISFKDYLKFYMVVIVVTHLIFGRTIKRNTEKILTY